MYKNALEKLDEFFTIDLRRNFGEIFTVLKKIIQFNSGCIYLSDNNKYSSNSENSCEFEISENLKIKNAVFGVIKIQRNQEFSQKEQRIFKTCASIIANIIKEHELSKIISQQLKTLQEGIQEKDEAYKSVKSQNEFFANFSHELRTPLSAVIGSSELLAEGIFGNLNTKQAEYINDIRISALHLLGMINDILDISKLEAKSMKLNLTQFELSRTSDEVCNILKPLAQKKHITILKDYGKNTEIRADYSKIQQVLFNLINNAIKYTPDNGLINISIKKENRFIIIKVKDNGIGIEKKYHRKIFNKFVQLGTQKNSNGLGLTITKELVKLHNGRISLNSAPNEGAEFLIKLPVKNL